MSGVKDFLLFLVYAAAVIMLAFFAVRADGSEPAPHDMCFLRGDLSGDEFISETDLSLLYLETMNGPPFDYDNVDVLDIDDDGEPATYQDYTALQQALVQQYYIRTPNNENKLGLDPTPDNINPLADYPRSAKDTFVQPDGYYSGAVSGTPGVLPWDYVDYHYYVWPSTPGENQKLGTYADFIAYDFVSGSRTNTHEFEIWRYAEDCRVPMKAWRAKCAEGPGFYIPWSVEVIFKPGVANPGGGGYMHLEVDMTEAEVNVEFHNITSRLGGRVKTTQFVNMGYFGCTILQTCDGAIYNSYPWPWENPYPGTELVNLPCNKTGNIQFDPGDMEQILPAVWLDRHYMAVRTIEVKNIKASIIDNHGDDPTQGDSISVELLWGPVQVIRNDWWWY